MLLQLLLLWLPAIAYCCYPNQTNKDTARCQNQTRDLLGYALLFLSLYLSLSLSLASTVPSTVSSTYISNKPVPATRPQPPSTSTRTGKHTVQAHPSHTRPSTIDRALSKHKRMHAGTVEGMVMSFLPILCSHLEFRV